MVKKLIASCFFLFAFTVCSQVNDGIVVNKSVLDSIDFLRSVSKDKTLSLDERFVFAERARRMSVDLGIDSTIIKSNRRISVIYYEMKNYNLFKKINNETLQLAKRIGDSSSIGKANFNLGNFFYLRLENDSAYFYYYNAEKIYVDIDDKLNAARVLQNMALVQQDEKDFIGSQETAVMAIKYLEPLLANKKNVHKELSGVYNNLGITLKELGQYEKAIDYYNQSYEILKKSGKHNGIKGISNRNNVAVVYENMNKHERALSLFSELLNKDVLKDEYPISYAMTLNNYARNKFLINKDDKDLPKLYFRSLAIRDSLQDKGGIMRSSINISTYYLEHDSLDLAINYARKAYEIASNYDLFDDQLETLLLLSKIEKGDNALLHAQKYIALNDSLHKVERAIRNKFARIEFETDKIEEQNEKISRERELFLTLAIALGLTAFLIFVIISQRSRNNELRYNQEQQKANEEIYNLMLSQQDKIDEGRTKEKQRISEDLHDGILGRLFGTRLSLDSLNMSSDADAVKNRGQYIEELKSIEQEIRRISHDLNADFVAGSGYLDIVKTLIENQTQAYGLTYKFNHIDEIDWESVSNKTKIHFYRMIQESMQNIYKHANASHVDISFESREQQIFLSIVDNGEGFVVNKAKKGIGLKNIRSRVEELKGELFINSKKNAGTSISISVPL